MVRISESKRGIVSSFSIQHSGTPWMVVAKVCHIVDSPIYHNPEILLRIVFCDLLPAVDLIRVRSLGSITKALTIRVRFCFLIFCRYPEGIGSLVIAPTKRASRSDFA